MSTRSASICSSSSSPASTLSPTAIADSTPTSAARAGPAIRHPTWQGFDRHNPRPVPSSPGKSLVWFPAGHILHDYLESRLLPPIVGPVGRGDLQYAALWRTAQRLTTKPVKFGTVTAEIIGLLCADHHYKDVRTRIMAISDALREELHELADAGCPVIQIEEPQIHLLAARGFVSEVINPSFMVEVYNNTVKGLRDKTEVWCHSCWGNPSQQRMFAEVQSYKPAIEYFNRCDADVITFESCSSGGIDLEAIGTGHRRQEDRHRRDRPSYAAGGTARGRGRRTSGAP